MMIPITIGLLIQSLDSGGNSVWILKEKVMLSDKNYTTHVISSLAHTTGEASENGSRNPCLQRAALSKRRDIKTAQRFQSLYLMTTVSQAN